MATFPRHIPLNERLLEPRINRTTTATPDPWALHVNDTAATLRGIPTIGVPGGYPSAIRGTTPGAGTAQIW